MMDHGRLATGLRGFYAPRDAPTALPTTWLSPEPERQLLGACRLFSAHPCHFRESAKCHSREWHFAARVEPFEPGERPRSWMMVGTSTADEDATPPPPPRAAPRR